MTPLQYPEPEGEFTTMPAPYNATSDSTESTLQTKNFSVRCRFRTASRVYPYGYNYGDGHRAPKPDNLAEIQRMRPSLSPSRFSDGDFEEYMNKTNQASGKIEVIVV
jgi:hypothetical protein